MASHVLQGEPAAFLWGQRYKGVPEVYLAAAVFAVTGPSVVALKSVTLACFALFVCLQFVLVERLFSRSIAWIATAFLIIAPPSLVFWSLSASAEVVITMLAGTIMCLGIDTWRRTGSRTAFVAAWVAAGFGLWVQQFILYYWIAVAFAILHSLPQRTRILRMLLRGHELPPWLRGLTAVFAISGDGLCRSWRGRIRDGRIRRRSVRRSHRRAPRAETLEHRSCTAARRRRRTRLWACGRPARIGKIAGQCGRDRLRGWICPRAGRLCDIRRIAADCADRPRRGVGGSSLRSSGRSYRS